MMTYLEFHMIFILPITLVLWLVRPRQLDGRAVGLSIATLMTLALLYATPWDNWLVAERIWTYADDVVIGTIGYVPIEEYLFFLLQPILTGLWLVQVIARSERQWITKKAPLVRWGGAALWSGLALLSAVGFIIGDAHLRYLTMIVVWAAPVIAFQWAVGGVQLWGHWRIWLWGVLPPTLYLGIVDRIAIGADVWHITEVTSTGIMLFGLPVEEFLFFFLTNVMIVQGIFLFVWFWERDIFTTIRQRLLPEIPVQTSYVTGGMRKTIRRAVLVPSWVILAAMTGLFLLPVTIPLSVQLIPLLLSAVILGLPHGAIDHLVPGRVARTPLNWMQMTLLLVGYLLVAGLVMGLWWLSPSLGFVFFILLTWLHWGLGDLHAALAFTDAGFLVNRPLRLMTAVVRGGLPMLVPLVAFPADYARAATSIIEVLGGTDAPGWAFTTEFRGVVAVAFGVLVVITLAATYVLTLQTGRGGDWYLYAGETLLLLLYFAVVPPFLAVGLYFCLWHSTRHIARLILLQPLVDDKIGLAFGRFMKAAAPLTGVSLIMLVGLYFVVPTTPDDALSLVALYLVLIAALTLPHTLVVMWLDDVQGIWSVDTDVATPPGNDGDQPDRYYPVARSALTPHR